MRNYKMLNYNNWSDNLAIFYANLTWFHVVSMIVSWLALFISTWKGFALIRKQNVKPKQSPVVEDSIKEPTEDSLQTQYKLAKQKLVERDLTPEQRSKEKEAEGQQLAAILKLLQEKSETFQVASMDQLENQLRLYRKC